MTPTGARNQTMFAKLCWPRGRSPRTVQLLVHGISYDGRYWSFPDPSGGTPRYHYVAAATKAGFATLAIDRIGSGRSSHPVSTQLTIDSNAYTVHQAVQALRDGSVRIPQRARFAKVVYVGHSYGTWTGWNEVSRYDDVDAAVFTGAFEEVSMSAPLLLLPSMVPAALDPRFENERLDPGYLTTTAGTRDELFYKPARYDRKVVAHDERTKQTLTVSEILNFPQILNRNYQIKKPTLLVAGTNDALFCRESLSAFPPVLGGTGTIADLLDNLAEPLGLVVPTATQDVSGIRWGGANCDTPRALIRDERAHLGHPKKLDAFVLQGAGHDLNQALNAPQYFEAVNAWVARNVGR